MRFQGHVSLGRSSGASPALLEIATFRETGVGTPDALFGDSFASDVANRDFACNTLYYEPINDVLIDPTGHGIEDALSKRLRIVCDTTRCTQHQLAQAALRCCRFRRQGYELLDDEEKMARDFLPTLREMPSLNLIGHFRAHVFIGVSDGGQRDAFEALRQIFEELGAPEVWHDAVAPIAEEILTP